MPGKKYSGGLSDNFLNKLEKTIEDTVTQKITEGLQAAADNEYEIEVNNVKAKVNGSQIKDQLAKNLTKKLNETKVDVDTTIEPNPKIEKGSEKKVEKKVQAFIKGATEGTKVPVKVDDSSFTSFAEGLKKKAQEARLEYKDLLDIVTEASKLASQFEKHTVRLEDPKYEHYRNQWTSYGIDIDYTTTDTQKYIENYKQGLTEVYRLYKNIQSAIKNNDGMFKGTRYREQNLSELKGIFGVIVSDLRDAGVSIDEIIDSVPRITKEFKEIARESSASYDHTKELDDIYENEREHIEKSNKALERQHDILKEIIKIAAGDDWLREYNATSYLGNSFDMDQRDYQFGDIESIAKNIARVLGIEIPDAAGKTEKALNEANETSSEEKLADKLEINNKSLKERLEYLKQLKAESKFMETARDRLSDMEEKGWDAGGHNPKSEADSLKKIKAYEDLEEHIDRAETSMDEFNDTYEKVIITFKDGTEEIIQHSEALSDISLVANRIKDIKFFPIEEEVEDAQESSEQVAKYVKKTDDEIYAAAQELAQKEKDIFKEIADSEIALASKASGETRKLYGSMAEASKKLFDDGAADYQVEEKIKETSELITSLQDKLKKETDPEAILSLNEQLDNAKIKILALEEAFKNVKVGKDTFSTANFDSDVLDRYWRQRRENYTIGESNFSISTADREYWQTLTKGITTEKELSDAITARKERMLELNTAIDTAENNQQRLYDKLGFYQTGSPEYSEAHKAWLESVEATNKIVEDYNEVRTELYNLNQLQQNWGKSIEECAQINNGFLNSEWREEEKAMIALDNEIWDLAEARKSEAKAQQQQQQASEDTAQAQEQERKSNEANNETQDESQQESHESADAAEEEAQAHRNNADAIREENEARRESAEQPDHGYLRAEAGKKEDTATRSYIEKVNDFINKRVTPVSDKDGNIVSYDAKYLFDYDKALSSISTLDEKILKQIHDIKGATEEEAAPMLTNLHILEAQRKEAEDWVKTMVESPESNANEHQLEEIERIRAAKREQLQAELRIQDAQAETARVVKEQAQADKEAAANMKMLNAAYAENADKDAATRKKFLKDWDDAIIENMRRDKQSHEKFLKDWDAAIQEDEQRARQKVADTFADEDLEYLDKRNRYQEEGIRLAAKYAAEAQKAHDAKASEYENIFYSGNGKLKEVEFAPNTEALKNSNALYDELETSIKRVYALKEANLKLDKDTLAGEYGLLKNDKEITELKTRIQNILLEINAAEAVQEDRENELLELDRQRDGVLQDILQRQELQSRDQMSLQAFGWLKNIEKLQATGKYTQEFQQHLEEAKNQLKEFDAASGSIDEVNASFKNLEQTIERINIDKTLSDFKKAQSVSISKLDLQITEFMQKNTAMGRQFRQEFENLKIDWDTEHSLAEVQQLADAFAKLKARVSAAEKTGASFFDTLRQRAMGVNAQLIAQYLSWQDLIRYIRQAITVVKDLDYELIDLKKTTSMSSKELKEFYFSANETAKQMGVTTKEIIAQGAAWSRLGYASKEAATEMAALSSQFAQISPGMDVETATDGLVSAMKAFHYDVADVESEIMDVINKTGNTMATNNEEIVEMLKRSSAAMSAANNSIRETIALESAAVQITRNAETTGTAFRTISMRIRGYDEETEEYIGGIEELTGKIADLTKTAATPGGISLFTDETKSTYKSTYQLLKDISEIYDQLSDAKQAELLEALAGKRGGQVLAGVLGKENFAEVERAMQNMREAAGSAAAEMSIVEESIDYKLNKLEQTWVGIIQELIDNGMLGQLIDALTKISEVLGDIITTIGPLPTLIAGLGLRELILNLDNIPQALSLLDTLFSGASIDTTHLSDVGQIFHDITEDSAEIAEVISPDALEEVGKIFIDTAEGASELSEETEAVVEKIGSLNDVFGTVAEEATTAAESTETLSEAAGSLTSELAGGFKALIPILTNPITIMTALAAATYALYKWVDEANERQRKKIQSLQKEFNELSTQLQSTNDELSNVDKQIKEIQSQGTISLVEQQELERLRTQAELLKLARQEQEELLKLKAQELTDENTKHFNKVYGGLNQNDITNPEERLKGYEQKVGNEVKFSYGENLSNALASASKGEYNDNPNELLAIYQQVQKAREDALKTIQEYSKANRELTEEEQAALEGAKIVIADTDDYFTGLEIQIGKVKTELLNMKQSAVRAGTEEGNALAASIDNALKLVYQYSGTSKEWNAMQIDSIFDNSKLEVTRTELEALAKAGELSEATLEKYPILKESIESLNLILEDGETAWSLFSNEMKAAGDTTSEVAKSISKVDNALSSMYSISKLNDLESALNDVGTAMANIDEHGKFQLGDLDKIADYFIALESSEKKVKYESKAVSDALQLLGEGSGDIKANADAINTLVDNYIRTSDVLKGLTEENKALYETRLKMMGIVNAETIVEEALAADRAKDIDATLVAKVYTEQLAKMKDALQAEDQEEVDQIAEVINALLDEADANENTRRAIEYLIKVQSIFNNQDLNVNEKITQLEKLANAYLNTADAAELNAKVEALQESKKYLKGAGMTAEIKAAQIAKIDAEIEKLMNEGVASLRSKQKVKYTKAEYNGGTPLKDKLGKDSASTEEALANATKKAAEDAAKAAYDAEHAYKEVIDYFERMIKVVDNSISLLEAHLEDVVGSFAKNKLLDAEEDLIQSKLNSYSAAVDMYSRKAEEALAKIPKDIADKLISGAVDIDEFISQGDQEVVDAIQDYQTWADKVADARLQLVQLKETLRQLELQKFNNLMKDFTDQFDLRQSNGIDLIQKQIALLEEAGELVGQSYYERMKEQTQKQLEILSREQEALVNQLNEALSRGVDVGSDEWLEMQDALTDVEGKILDCKKALEEFDNALLALHTEVFNRIQEQFSLYQSELSNMEALFDDESMKVADENGEWTKEGLARLGLLAQQYELAQEQVRMYGEEIEKLNQDYLDGKYSTTEYMEKLAQLKQEQWAAVNASEDAKDAIVALNKARIEIAVEGIEKEIDAYEKLIQKQKELLSTEKDLHDYQKSIAESEKDIVALQKQLAAIAGDDSAAARAKRLKLEEQLADKQAELEEKQYDHSIDQQQDALDKQLEQYKETRQLEIEELQNSLLEIEKMLTDAFEAVRENSETIGNEIIEKAREHGIEMSEYLTDAWFQGENAIARYGETLTSETSNFISGIQEVENNIWGLQDQANATADDLANMLATRADNLVDELNNAKNSEENLDAMTNALHDSLSSTIDGSYAGTSAKNALAGITDAADELADSAERARRALLELLEAETKTPKWEIYDRHGNLITTTDDPDEARKFADDPTVIVKRVGGYASGSKRIAQNEIAWTQEKGAEMIISPSSGAILTPLKKNDAVIPADMTSNLWEWGRFNPEEFAEKLLSAGKVSGAGAVTTNTMQVGSLVTVNGNVNDSIEMMKIASQQATAKIKQSWNDFSNTIRG